MAAENIDLGVDLSAPVAVEDDDLTLQLKAAATKRKGRGFGVSDERGDDMEADFDTAPDTQESVRAQRSVEGWIIFVTGINEEASEETVTDKFADFGKIKNIRMEMDRRTGFYKGYAFIEYDTFKEAQNAIQATDGKQFLGQTIHADFAFVKGAPSSGARGGGRSARRSGPRRGRSPSPRRTVDF